MHKNLLSESVQRVPVRMISLHRIMKLAANWKSVCGYAKREGDTWVWSEGQTKQVFGGFLPDITLFFNTLQDKWKDWPSPYHPKKQWVLEIWVKTWKNSPGYVKVALLCSLKDRGISLMHPLGNKRKQGKQGTRWVKNKLPGLCGPSVVY